MADDKTPSTLAKITGAVAALAAAWVAQKAITAAWKATAGHEPPKPEDDTDSGLGEIAAAAVLTGALVALSRVLATRSTAKFAARVNRNRLTPKA